MHGEPEAEGSFGPAVIFAALVEAGVRFHFVGFVTHYACQLYHQQHPANPASVSWQPQSHAENRIRLARALRELGVVAQTDNGAAVAVGQQRFETRHGDINVFVRTPTADEAVPGMDELSDGIRISITVPTTTLRSYVATGEFPGLLSVLEIVELFDASGSSGDANRGRP